MADGAGPSGHATAGEEDDDPVVMELPVYVCNAFMGGSTQLALLQHPLRPPWRPYHLSSVDSIRMKPNAKRVEIDIPMDTKSSNYNDIIEDFKKISQVTLRSQLVDSKASLAIGTIQDGKLLLVPLDYGLQMRPTLAHLNLGNMKKGKDDEEEDSDDEPMMRPVEVQVQKRETERQQQARLNSYAHLSAKEDEEAWQILALHNADSGPAETIWHHFVAPKDTHIASDMRRPAFLRAFVPSVGGQQNSLVAGDAVGPGAGEGPSGGAGGDAGGDLGAARGASEAVPPEKLKALEVALKQLFSKHGVATMGNIRQWLQDPSANAGIAKDLGTTTDRALHDALMETKQIECIRRVYLLKPSGAAATDPFRSVVIELLKEKESFKRSEVIDAAQQKNINVTDTMYNKVVKDICQSKGMHWMLKLGADLQ